MDPNPGHLGDLLPGEVQIASYWRDRLVLTDRRVLYRRGGLQRGWQAVPLREVAGVFLEKGGILRPTLFLVPAVLFTLTFWTAFNFNDVIVLSVLYPAILSLVLPFVIRGWRVRIATSSKPIRLHMPLRQQSDIRVFLQQIERQRDRLAAGTGGNTAAPSAIRFES